MMFAKFNELCLFMYDAVYFMVTFLRALCRRGKPLEAREIRGDLV